MTVSSLNESIITNWMVIPTVRIRGRALAVNDMAITQILRVARRVCLLLCAFTVLSGVNPANALDRRVVNLELLLLIDVSASVDDAEFRLQSAGLAAAFASPAVLDAIRSISRGGMAVSVVQWADHAHQEVVVDWTYVSREADALKLARQIAEMPRRIHGGHTALGDALAYALHAINANPYSGLRRVIDLSGDGRSNDGRSLSRTRDDVLDSGITINGLAILNEIPLLGKYFSKHLIGGDAAFMMTARDYSDFADAIRRKLVREIRSAPIVRNRNPEHRRSAMATRLTVSKSGRGAILDLSARARDPVPTVRYREKGAGNSISRPQ